MLSILLGREGPPKDANYNGCLSVWRKLHLKERDLLRLRRTFDRADADGSGEARGRAPVERS